MSRVGACRFLSSPLLFSLLFLPFLFMFFSIRLLFSLRVSSIRHPFCPRSLDLPSSSVIVPLLSPILLPCILTDPARSTK
ncbi:hypothetical protein B0H13DRAFT_2030139 [Mycena leptocephala]|nr:hypothetical protein B0H13DRAFT_2030139 [Mycena leptocephala]